MTSRKKRWVQLGASSSWECTWALRRHRLELVLCILWSQSLVLSRLLHTDLHTG